MGKFMVCLAGILPLCAVLLLLTSLAASQPAPTPPVAKPVPTPVPLPSISNKFKSIEEVDFANFTFSLPFPEQDCAGLKSNTVPLRGGEFKDTSQEFGVEVSLGKIVYADLTGDRINEALVHLNCDPHGNYVDTVTLAYTLRDGEPVLLGRFANSNTERDYRRYYPDGFVFPVGAASVANGKVQIHRAADGSHACPENDVSFEYSWNGKSFVLSGEPVKRPLKNCGAEEKPSFQPTSTPPDAMSHEVIDRTLRACAIINDRDYSQHITLGATPWIHLNRGQENDGYLLSHDGSLFYRGQMLAHNVPVSAVSSREGDQWIYAQSVLLSPKSPSDRFAILQACEEQDLSGLPKVLS
jgi:hypothetical protein